MKSIILSVQPKWVEKILNKTKTIEIRKVIPQCETPFKVYVYCTDGFMLRDHLRCGIDTIQGYVKNGKLKRFDISDKKSNNVICSSYPFVNRKVVASFICDKVDFLAPKGIKDIPLYYSDKWLKSMISKACLTCEEAIAYQNNKSDLYALHISDLKVYDKPKELNDFRPYCNKKEKCWKDVVRHCDDVFSRKCMDLVINKPPQSWQYVEEIKDKE